MPNTVIGPHLYRFNGRADALKDTCVICGHNQSDAIHRLPGHMLPTSKTPRG